MHPAVEPMATTATVMAASPLKKADMDDLDNVLDTLAKGKAEARRGEEGEEGEEREEGEGGRIGGGERRESEE